MPGCEHARPWSQKALYLRCSRVTPRQREMIELGFLWRCVGLGVSLEASSAAAVRARVAQGLFVDLSQNPTRAPWRCGEVAAITTSSQIYSYELDTVLLPEELWAAYGRFVRRAEACSATQIRSLLGNCMAVQPVATVMHALVAGVCPRLTGAWGCQ